MKKRLTIGCMFLLIPTLFGCTAQPNQIELDEAQETIEHSKVEELNYWVIGKDAQHNFNIETEATVEPETTVTPQGRSIEKQNSVGDALNNMSNVIAEKQNFTEEQKNSILQQIDEYKNGKNGMTSQEFISLIDANIASFDQRERDLIVKKYMLSLYDTMNGLNSVLEVIGYDMEEAVKEYNINVNDKQSIANLPDSYGTIRGFLLEVKDKGFFVNNNGNNEGFYIDLDLGNMLDKYRDYISPSLIAYMEFNNYEMNNILVDYDVQEIAKRINMLEDGMAKDKLNHYVMADRYTSSITYYYQLLLGLSHNSFVEKDGTFKQSILDEYAQISGSATLEDIVTKMTLAIQTNEMVYDEKVKGLVSDYLNSKIYTMELNGILDNKNTYTYRIMTEEELKPIIKEKTDEPETEEVTEETQELPLSASDTQIDNRPNNSVSVLETRIE